MAPRIIIAVFAALILAAPVATPVMAAEFDKGLTAYGRGDYAAAHQVWLALGKRGHAPAQYNLGQMYRNGQGVPRDLIEAAKWYRLAALGNHPWAQYNLGSMYIRGLGVPRDDVQGYKWFSLAAAQGDAEAITNRGLLAKRMSAAEIAAADKSLRQAKAAQKTALKLAKAKARRPMPRKAQKTAPKAARKTAPAPDTQTLFQVQFGAMKDRENAERGAAQLIETHGEALGGLKLAVIPADLGERGKFYRLRAEPVKGRAAADQACLRFKMRAVHCFVAPRENSPTD